MEKNNFEYFYRKESEQFSFFRIPKLLFSDQRFHPMSVESKVLYGLLLDRMGLSMKNNWHDENGKVYIIYTIEEIMRDLGCGNKKANKILAEIVSIGLIAKKRQGLGKPNLIFVKNFVVQDANPKYPPKTPNANTKPYRTAKNIKFESRPATGNTDEKSDPLMKITSIVSKSAPQSENIIENKITQKPHTYQGISEVSKRHFKECQNDISRDVKTTFQEVSKGHANKTYSIKTDNNHLSFRSSSEKCSEREGVLTAPTDDTYRNKRIDTSVDEIKNQIEYEKLTQVFNPKTMDALVQIMLRVALCPDAYMRIGAQGAPTSLVQMRFKKLNTCDISCIMSNLNQVKKPIKNMSAYLLQCLYRQEETIQIQAAYSEKEQLKSYDIAEFEANSFFDPPPEDEYHHVNNGVFNSITA